MDWAAGSRWQKAMIISLLLHSIVIIGVGYLAGKAVMPVKMPETRIELELASDLAGSPLTTATTAVFSASQETVPHLPPPTPVGGQVAQAAVVAASDMVVVAVDSGAIVSAVAPATGAGDSAAGATGSSSGSVGSTGTAREVIPPGILSRREPNYPEKARRVGVEGTVVLTIEILENGHAGQVSIYQSSGSELLDDAAAAAVQRWRFVPAKVRGTGQSIACQTTMPVVFKLKA